MNVLNVPDIERELRKYAARTISPHGKRWVMTVARNYILGRLPEKDVLANFREVCLCGFSETVKLPHKVRHDAAKYDPPELPEWAALAVERGETLMWFDPIQPRRRELWNVLDVIVHWLNNWKRDDPRFRRVDRIAFPVATNAAVLWYKDVSENIWHYVTDKPVLVKSYDEGFRWVKLVTQLQFEREGRLMNHCVGNGGYYNRWRTSNSSEFFSLRDSHNNPHATMEVAYENSHPLVRKGSVVQCRGNSNRRPDNRYQPFIKRFIEDMKFKVAGDGSLIGV